MDIRKRLAQKQLVKKQGVFEVVDLTKRDHPKWMTRSFHNNHFVVMINDHTKSDKGPCIQCLIQRHDNSPIPNHWAEIQKIKNEIFGPETEAIEFFPPENELVDMHNIYWIWIFPDGILPKIQFGISV